MSRFELVTSTRGNEPSRYQRLMNAVRSFYRGPLSLKDPELARWFGHGPTSSGIHVTEDSALAYSAVWSAVSMISDDIASLPLVLYKRLANGGTDRYEAHPLYELLHDQPNPEMTTMVWRRTMQAHLLIWGNAYAEIQRDNAGRPIAIWPLVPERVSPIRERGVLTYRVANPGGRDVMIEPADMIHLVGMSHDGSVGCSIVEKARESFGLGLAAQQFGNSFFGNGATFGGVISYQGPKPPEMSEQGYVAQIQARHQGVERAHKILALYNGATFTQNGVEPDSAQFLETRVFQIREVARWFKIPPHKLADLADATFSNVEQQNIDYYSSCLRPWLRLWEEELGKKLISRLERRSQFIGHVTQGFLSADAAGRAALYTAEFSVGAITPNEIRGFEGLDPIAGGDTAFVPINNLLPLNRVDEYVTAQIDALKAKAEPPPAPVAPQPNPQDEADRAALRAAIAALEASVEAERAERRTAQTKAEDLSGALAEATTRADSAQADLSAALEQLDGAKTSLAAAEAELLRTMAQHVADLADREAATSEQVAEARAEADRARLLYDQQARVVAEITTERDRLVDDLQAVATEADEARAQVADRDAILAIRDSRISDLEQREAELVRESESNEAAWTQEQSEREAEAERSAAAMAKLKTAMEELVAQSEKQALELPLLVRSVAERDLAATQLADEKAAAEAQRDAEKARADAAEADLAATVAGMDSANAALEARIAAVDAERQSANLIAQQAEADKVAAEMRAEAAEQATAIAEGAQAAANAMVEARRQAEIAKAGDVIAAHRSLLVDAMQRLITRETDRARKNQATPAKLAAWADTFYDGHLETMAETLTPILRAHLAWMQSEEDPATVARSMAESYVAASRQQIAAVVTVDDYHDALERTMRRWETMRPDGVADRVLRDSVNHVRSL